MVPNKSTNSDGAVSTVSFGLTVENVAPDVDADFESISVDEGETAQNSGTFDDPGDDTAALSASIGSVNDNGDGTYGGVGDNPDQTTVTDAAGLYVVRTSGGWVLVAAEASCYGRVRLLHLGARRLDDDVDEQAPTPRRQLCLLPFQFGNGRQHARPRLRADIGARMQNPVHRCGPHARLPGCGGLLPNPLSVSSAVHI